MREPRPLFTQCQVTDRSVKGADASLRDRAGSTRDPPAADRVRRLSGDGAAVVTVLRDSYVTTGRAEVLAA
ncbi:MAG: hypothetical protein ACRDQA_14555 [Nocardioidaceae bacterium]